MKGARVINHILIENTGNFECQSNDCDSFAHCDYFTHDAIMDLCNAVALGDRDYDLCKYTKHELAYLYGLDKPNYPVPAIRQRDWIEIGYLSALNGFDTSQAFEFIKRFF